MSSGLRSRDPESSLRSVLALTRCLLLFRVRVPWTCDLPRARYSVCVSVPSALLISCLVVTGKVVAEGEQRGVHACFDVFVKDTSGKCAITVAVIGDLRDVQTSEMLEKEVDFKGRMQENREFYLLVLPPLILCYLAAGELEFIVAGWADVIPCSVGENVSRLRSIRESYVCASERRTGISLDCDSKPELRLYEYRLASC